MVNRSRSVQAPQPSQRTTSNLATSSFNLLTRRCITLSCWARTVHRKRACFHPALEDSLICQGFWDEKRLISRGLLIYTEWSPGNGWPFLIIQDNRLSPFKPVYSCVTFQSRIDHRLESLI